MVHLLRKYQKENGTNSLKKLIKQDNRRELIGDYKRMRKIDGLFLRLQQRQIIKKERRFRNLTKKYITGAGKGFIWQNNAIP